VKERREAIEAAGTQLAFVYQGSEKQAAASLHDMALTVISVPGSRYSPVSSVRIACGSCFNCLDCGCCAVTCNQCQKDTPGIMTSDGLQLPGVFLLIRAGSFKELRHGTVADRPDYVALQASNHRS